LEEIYRLRGKTVPSTLALALTVAFILFLLRLDRKQYPTASYALWIPTIWMLLITGKALGIWFGGGDGDIEEGSTYDRMFLSALFLIGMTILIKRRFNWKNSIKDNTSLILLVGFMLVSVLWSDTPFVSLKRWIREAGIPIAMAFLVSTEADPRQALKCLFRRSIYVQIPLSFLLIKYYPDLGVRYSRWSGEIMWTGVSTMKNGLALFCVFALFFLLWTLIRRWRELDIPVTRYQTYIEVFVIILSIWLFMGPKHTPMYSSTAFAALTLGFTTLLCLSWLKGRNIILGKKSLSVAIALLIFYGTIIPFAGEGLKMIDPSYFGRDQTLTGRVDIWAGLVPYAVQRPFLGYGFGGFWDRKSRAVVSDDYAEAHNGYLDTILNIGVVGLILLSIFLIASCRKAQREMTIDADWGFFWFCIILMAVVHNIAESSTTSFMSIMPAAILFLNVSLQSRVNEL
jgi:exopolysaccharide production protein ExoQ